MEAAQGALKKMLSGDMVGLDPNMKAPGFKRFNPNEEDLAFNLNLVCLSLYHYNMGGGSRSRRSAQRAARIAALHLAAQGAAGKKQNKVRGGGVQTTTLA